MNHKGAPAFSLSFFALKYFLVIYYCLEKKKKKGLLNIRVRLQSTTGFRFSKKGIWIWRQYNNDSADQKYLALSWNSILVKCWEDELI